MTRRIIGPGLLAILLAAPGLATTITVNSNIDDTTSGNCTLREAVLSATTNLAVDECPPGSPNLENTIEVPAGIHALLLGEIVIGGAAPLKLRGPAGPAVATIRAAEVAPSRLFRIQPNSGATFERLTLTLGSNPNAGGAIASQLSSLVLRDCRLEANSAPFGAALNYWGAAGNTLLIERTVFAANGSFSASGVAFGGGAWVFLAGGSSGRIVDSVFDLNTVTTTSGSNEARGGGLDLELQEGSVVEVLRTTFTRNRLDCGPAASSLGSGLYVNVVGEGTRATVVDSTIVGNDIVPPTVTLYGGALQGQAANGAALILDRLRIAGNDPGESGIDLPLFAYSAATIAISNLLLANGPGTGVALECTDSDCSIGQATITQHAQVAADLRTHGSGQVRLENSILFASSALVQSGAVTIDPSNLIGVDPAFLDSVGGDYRLGATSPAIDFGTAALSSVGPYDLAHAPRVAGPETDAGAFEFAALFADGFESRDRGAWSATVL